MPSCQLEESWKRGTWGWLKERMVVVINEGMLTRQHNEEAIIPVLGTDSEGSG